LTAVHSHSLLTGLLWMLQDENRGLYTAAGACQDERRQRCMGLSYTLQACHRRALKRMAADA
jgi:hypothetical protein